jgi:hypothetical protein
MIPQSSVTSGITMTRRPDRPRPPQSMSHRRKWALFCPAGENFQKATANWLTSHPGVYHRLSIIVIILHNLSMKELLESVVKFNRNRIGTFEINPYYGFHRHSLLS